MATIDPQLMLSALANLQSRGVGMQNPDLLAAELGRATGSTDLNSLLEQAQAFIKGGSEKLGAPAKPDGAAKAPASGSRPGPVGSDVDGPGGDSGGSAGAPNVSGSMTSAGRGALSGLNVLGTQLGGISPFSLIAGVNTAANALGINTPGVTNVNAPSLPPGTTMGDLGMNQSLGIQSPTGTFGLDVGGPNAALAALAAMGQALGLGPNPTLAIAGNPAAFGIPTDAQHSVFGSNVGIPGAVGALVGLTGVDPQGNVVPAGAATGIAPTGSTNFGDAPNNTSNAPPANAASATVSADPSAAGPASGGVGDSAPGEGGGPGGDGPGVGPSGSGVGEFKKGGRVKSTRPGSVQPINAHEGEYVMNPTASAAFWPLLEALNKLVPPNPQMDRMMGGSRSGSGGKKSFLHGGMVDDSGGAQAKYVDDLLKKETATWGSKSDELRTQGAEYEERASREFRDMRDRR